MIERMDAVTRIERTSSGAMEIIAPYGKLELQSAGALRAVVETALGRCPLILAVDLRGVTFLGCEIVGELVAIGRRCDADGRRLLIVRGGAQADALLAGRDLDGRFDLIAGLDEIPGGEFTGSLLLRVA